MPWSRPISSVSWLTLTAVMRSIAHSIPSVKAKAHAEDRRRAAHCTRKKSRFRATGRWFRLD